MISDETNEWNRLALAVAHLEKPVVIDMGYAHERQQRTYEINQRALDAAARARRRGE